MVQTFGKVPLVTREPGSENGFQTLVRSEHLPSDHLRSALCRLRTGSELRHRAVVLLQGAAMHLLVKSMPHPGQRGDRSARTANNRSGRRRLLRRAGDRLAEKQRFHAGDRLWHHF